MEGYGGGLKSYWRRNKYRRLVGGAGSGSRWRTHGRRRHVVLGDQPEATAARPRRFWRIRVTPRLQILRKLASPRRLLTRLRDAYVRIMMNFASAGPFGGGGPIDYYGGHRAAANLKEYDDKMIVEIYKSMVAQKHFVPVPGRLTEDPFRPTVSPH